MKSKVLTVDLKQEIKPGASDISRSITAEDSPHTLGRLGGQGSQSDRRGRTGVGGNCKVWGEGSWELRGSLL